MEFLDTLQFRITHRKLSIAPFSMRAYDSGCRVANDHWDEKQAQKEILFTH